MNKLYFPLLVLALLFFTTTNAQLDSCRMFVFGHSLIDHRPPLIATPSNETTVPHWMYLLSQAANNGYAAGGIYGFLPQHANVPPFSSWAYDIVPGVWESDYEPFGAADINTILITAGNFIQYQAPYLPYYGSNITPISATETVFDWLVLQEDSLNIYIYENWPDLAPFLSNGFPPTNAEFETYNNYLLNDFHNWWIEYQDSLISSRPDVNVRMIPVGPIIVGILDSILQNQIPITELYEDDAPHGRANIYFLASLITYSAVFNEPAPLNFTFPSLIDQSIQNNYSQIVNFVWNELNAFNFSDGSSRVFYDTNVSVNVELEENAINLFPNPTTGNFKITGALQDYTLTIFDANGTVFQTQNPTSNSFTIDINNLPNGMYFVEFQHNSYNNLILQKILKMN